MRTGLPGTTLATVIALAASAWAGDRLGMRGLPGLLPGENVAVEMVQFSGPGQASVRLLRGMPPPARIAAQRVEIVSFEAARRQRVVVVRGNAAVAPAIAAAGSGQTRREILRFAEAGGGPVTVVRGAVTRDFALGLFDPAEGGALDRIAFAVDGVESRHGADLRMWRDSLAGPQGPMQVSLAAALDVGGGDRFDLRQNRLLGRAYLAQMFHRYGNWADALAAYNWGPANMDAWIARGRPGALLPPGVAHYVSQVLRDALLGVARL